MPWKTKISLCRITRGNTDNIWIDIRTILTMFASPRNKSTTISRIQSTLSKTLWKRIKSEHGFSKSMNFTRICTMILQEMYGWRSSNAAKRYFSLYRSWTRGLNLKISTRMTMFLVRRWRKGWAQWCRLSKGKSSFSTIRRSCRPSSTAFWTGNASMWVFET